MADGEGAANGQLMDIGTVASLNIVRALGLNESDAKTIRDAIRDEISAMSSHFTLAVAEQQMQFEIETMQLKSGYRYVKANLWRVMGAALGVFVFGVALGAVL